MDATGNSMSERRNNIPQLAITYVSSLTNTLEQLNTDALTLFVDTLLDMREKRGTLYLCGNGGSAANAIHLANDFTFGINPQGNALKVEALPANSSILTCLGNDIGYDNIFSHQLQVKAEQQDVLLVLSGSGNSQNIINAISYANNIGMTTIGILGFDGGKAKAMLDQLFHFDVQDMQISEDTQVIIGHILMKALYEELQDE